MSFTEEFDIPINKFQTSSKDTERYMGIRCKRPKKLELEHDDDGPDYDEGERKK